MQTRSNWFTGLAAFVIVGLSCSLAMAQAKPIKLGQIIPMSGEAVEDGQYHKQGAELAVDKINAAGGINGRKIQIVLEDDQTTNPGAVAALQKLLEDKEIPMIIGSIRSTQIQAMLPTINEAKIPVAIGGTNYALTHSGSRWVFRFRPHDGMSAKVVAKFIIEELKQKKVGMVHASDAFGNGGRDLVLPALKELGGEAVLVQAVNNGDKDFTVVAQAIKRSGVPALITYVTFATDLGVLVRQIKQQGVDAQLIGSPSLAAVATRNLGGDALFGSYAVADFHTDATSTSKAFAAAYKARYGKDPDFYSAWCYDAVTIFAEAMKKSPDLKPENLRNVLLGIQKYQGVEGEYNFDQNGDGLDHYHVVQNDKGSIKLFKTLRVNR